MEIRLTKHVYMYGKFYDADKTSVPKEEDNPDVIIYAQPLQESTRTISSLEGLFVSEIPLIEPMNRGITLGWQLVSRRDEMEYLEKKYQGKFLSFDR